MRKVNITLNLEDTFEIAKENFQLQDTTNVPSELNQLATMFSAFSNHMKLVNTGGQTMDVSVGQPSTSLTTTTSFEAVDLGVAGDGIALVFNGTTDTPTSVVAAWNAVTPAHDLLQVAFTGSDYVLTAQTVQLSGGSLTVKANASVSETTTIAPVITKATDIDLVFNGTTDTVLSVISAYNTANTNYPITYTGGNTAAIPSAQTLTLPAGSIKSYTIS